MEEMDCSVVTIKNGKIKGSVIQLEDEDAKPVYIYRNVPFAKPPVGNLRFMPPVPAEPWTGVRDATTVGSIPMQSRQFEGAMSKLSPMKVPTTPDKIKMEEDCLHLSVYTTKPGSDKKLPVMVWLYGGAFATGSELVYDGSALAGLYDVVVVVPNYRVNIFGFLSMGASSKCPGNVGLLDQNLALKWIHENIECFGGDKNNVTIFGESAGGMSVHFHILSPISRGLFHKAISHSGQATMPGYNLSDESIKKNLAIVLEHLNIKENDEDKILEALQKIPAPQLIKATEELAMKQVIFIPVVDRHFLPQSPKQIISEKKFSKVPYIIGCNNSEGDGLLPQLIIPNFLKGLTEEECKNFILIPNNPEIFEAWKKLYLKDCDEDIFRYSKLFGKITGDGMFVHPAVSTATVHSDEAETYLYQGAFQLRFHHDEEYGTAEMKKADWCICDHADDIHLFMGFPFTPGELPYGAKFSCEEALLSSKMMKYITNFAKNGDPNKGREVEVNWPKHQPRGGFIVFNHEISTGTDLEKERMEFWENTMNDLKKKLAIE